MIPCNGTHVIVHDHKHGRVVYRCTLANARRLLADCLADEAPQLNQFVEQLAQEKRPVRSTNWLANALVEVRELAENPKSLQLVWYGSKPRDGEDLRPMPSITREMQSELVVFCYHQGIHIDKLDRGSHARTDITTAWDQLSFLEPARARIGRDVWFVEEHLYTGAADLKVLTADRWKDTAKEENIVANRFCPFLNDWSMGSWSVEALRDA